MDNFMINDMVQAFSKSNTNLLSILNNMKNFAALLNIDGSIIFINDISLKTFHLKWENVIGKKFWDYSLWNNDDHISEVIRNNCIKTEKKQTTYQKIQVGSVWYELSYSPLLSEDNKLIYVLVEGHNIDAQIQIEQALIISENKYNALFKNSKDAYFLIHNNSFIDCNQAIIT